MNNAFVPAALLAIVAVVSTGSGAIAADLIIDVQKPWSFKPASSPWAASPSGAAVTAYRFSNDPELPYEAAARKHEHHSEEWWPALGGYVNLGWRVLAARGPRPETQS